MGKDAAAKAKAPAGTYWRGETLWARFKVQGVEYRESLRTGTPSVATKRLNALRSRIQDEAIYGGSEKISWKRAYVEWRQLAATNVRPSTVRRYVLSIRMIETKMSQLDVAQVTAEVVREIVSARRKAGASNATVRRDLSALSSVLAYAVEQGWITRNVAREYDRGQIKERRESLTMPDEASIQAVFSKLPPALRQIADFARATGARLEEVASLTWSQIDKPRSCAHLGRTKGKRGRTIELSPNAMAVIERQVPYLGSEWVFWHSEGERYASPSSGFRAVRDRVAQNRARESARAKAEKRPAPAPFSSFRFHDLRHLYIVESLKAGLSIYWVQKQVGHSSIQQTEEYADVFLTPAEAARAREGGGTQQGTEAAVSAMRAGPRD